MRATGSQVLAARSVLSSTSSSNNSSRTAGAGSDRSLATASNPSLDLKSILAKKIVEHQKRVKEFRSVYGSKGLGEVTVEQVSLFLSSNVNLVSHDSCFTEQVYGGMRGIKALVTETSYLDPEEGIRFR